MMEDAAIKETNMKTKILLSGLLSLGLSALALAGCIGGPGSTDSDPGDEVVIHGPPLAPASGGMFTKIRYFDDENHTTNVGWTVYPCIGAMQQSGIQTEYYVIIQHECN